MSLAAGFGLAAAVTGVGQAEEHRQLGAHVHGRGTLNIALEGSRLSMELEAPGADIVGFEHAPSTPEQKSTLEKAEKKLKAPQTVLQLPAAAGCSVTDAKVTIEGEHGGNDADDHDHGAEDHDHEHEAADHDHDHDAADQDHAGHQHSAFHAEYAFDCKSPASLTTIVFDYFKNFAGAQKLDVTVVTPKGQNSFEVSRDKPRIDLGGII
ncbi:MAG: DUF2796 domain-containing protein [Hyphomicrobiaceae bacterium]|nr:DUF2796 domain-containing protein [Hyphomicrobiaceae bacterium]